MTMTSPLRAMFWELNVSDSLQGSEDPFQPRGRPEGLQDGGGGEILISKNLHHLDGFTT